MIKDKHTAIGYHCPQCGMSVLNSVSMFSFSTAGNLIKLKCMCAASELTINVTRDKKFRLTVPCIVCPSSHSYAVSPHIFFERELFSFSCKFTALNICFIGDRNNVTEAIDKNEQALLATFAEYDDSFDSDEMTELSDIFDWDDDEDAALLNELFGDFDESDESDEEDDDGEFGFDAFMQKIRNNTPNIKIYKNQNFDSDGDGDPDLSLYAGFSAYSSAPKEPYETAGGIMGIPDIPDIPEMINYPVTSQILNTFSQLVRDKNIHCKCKNFDGRILLLENYVHIECTKCGSERNIKSSNLADIEYIAEMGELYLDFD